MFYSLSFEPTVEKIGAHFCSSSYFQVCIEIWKNATAILQNATRCTLKNVGSILKLNLGGDRILSQKS
jgi:hypothetical protein